MIVMNVNDRKDPKMETYPYKGKLLKVKDLWIRWLSQAAPEDSPQYGVRSFTIGPAGSMPIHNHFYFQTLVVRWFYMFPMCQ